MKNPNPNPNPNFNLVKLRFLAFLFEGLFAFFPAIIFIVFVIFGSLPEFQYSIPSPSLGTGLLLGFICFVFFPVFSQLFSTILYFITGKTFGYLALGLKAVDEKNPKKKAFIGWLFVRLLTLQVFLFISIYLLEFFLNFTVQSENILSFVIIIYLFSFLLFLGYQINKNPKGQTFYDKLSKILIVKESFSVKTFFFTLLIAVFICLILVPVFLILPDFIVSFIIEFFN